MEQSILSNQHKKAKDTCKRPNVRLISSRTGFSTEAKCKAGPPHENNGQYMSTPSIIDTGEITVLPHTARLNPKFTAASTSL